MNAAKREASRAIVEYLRAYPSASDSAEGIARFWLRDASLGECCVQRALEQLLASHLVERLAGLDGHVRWRRAPACNDEQLRQWLDADTHRPAEPRGSTPTTDDQG